MNQRKREHHYMMGERLQLLIFTQSVRLWRQSWVRRCWLVVVLDILMEKQWPCNSNFLIKITVVSKSNAYNLNIFFLYSFFLTKRNASGSIASRIYKSKSILVKAFVCMRYLCKYTSGNHSFIFVLYVIQWGLYLSMWLHFKWI